MQEMLFRILLGFFFVVIGLIFIFVHVGVIKACNDWYGLDMWTGKYTRGGKLFLQLLGVLFAIYGIRIILG